MNESVLYPPGFSDKDIFFDCPKCGKSLGIDRQGSGLIVTCPDCGQRMQVPVPELQPSEVDGPGMTTVSDYTRASTSDRRTDSADDVQRLAVNEHEILRRRHQLEIQQIEYASRFEKMREEIALVQASLDRMVSLLEGVMIDTRKVD